MRNSSVERIKIFAVILIILCHAVPDALSFPNGISFINEQATGNVLAFIVNLIAGFGLVGDVIFIVCSSYYLLESKRIKPDKIISMIVNVFIISVLFFIVIASLGYKMGTMTIVRQFFPTIFQNNWFVSYYIVFYLIHPLLNYVINRLDKKGLAIVAALLFVHCFIFLFVQAKAPGINKLLCFIAIYFIVAYFKYYGGRVTGSKKINLLLLAGSVVLYFGLRILFNYLGLHIAYFNCGLALWHINCPIILVFSLSLFNLANMRVGNNRAVNYFSSLSLLIYLISHNYLFAMFIQPLYFEWAAAFGFDYFIPFILLFAVILFVGSVLLSSLFRYAIENNVRKLVRKIIKSITNKVRA